MQTQCLKVEKLRKVYSSEDYDLEKWMSVPTNLYVGRAGRIFIKKERVFSYKGSKWANPFKLSDYSLEESLMLYKNHILSTNLYKDLKELEGLTLGCFCDQSGDCHAKILVQLFKDRDTLVPVEKEKLEGVKKVEEKKEICSAILRTGFPCKNKAKVMGKCGVHSK